MALAARPLARLCAVDRRGRDSTPRLGRPGPAATGLSRGHAISGIVRTSRIWCDSLPELALCDICVGMAPTGSALFLRAPNGAVPRKHAERRLDLGCGPGAVPVVLVLLSTRGNIGISYDSVMYASARRYYQETGSLDFPTIQPPLLQALIVSRVPLVRPRQQEPGCVRGSPARS